MASTDSNDAHYLKKLCTQELKNLEDLLKKGYKSDVDGSLPADFLTKYEINDFKRHIANLKLGSNKVVLKMIDYAYYETLRIVKEF